VIVGNEWLNRREVGRERRGMLKFAEVEIIEVIRR